MGISFLPMKIVPFRTFIYELAYGFAYLLSRMHYLEVLLSKLLTVGSPMWLPNGTLCF